MRETLTTGDTRQPDRAIAGNCPKCGRVVIVENHHESWPLVTCRCGWSDATTRIDNHTYLDREDVT